MDATKHYCLPTPMLLSFLLTMSAWSISAAIWLERRVLEVANVGPQVWIATAAATAFSVISAIAGRGFFSELARQSPTGRQLAVSFWQGVLVVAVMMGTGALIVYTCSWTDQL